MQIAESGIYALVSSVSGFRYIGQSVNLVKRKREHLKDLRNGSHHARHLQRHVNAHGIECIQYEVLELCGRDALTGREQHWMSHYDSTGLFNSVPASDSPIGFSPTPETRLKLSLAGKGRKRSAETRELMRITNSRPVSAGAVRKMLETRRANQAGKPRRELTPEHIAILVACNKARVHTEDSRARIGAASKGRIFSEAAREKMRTAATGRVLTAEEKAKISAANKGRVRSQAVRDKMSSDRRGKKQTPEHIANMKAGQIRSRLAKLAAMAPA